jgi:DNA polymerase I-like protein with 3'-5' exonuclease and polymerase domains
MAKSHLRQFADVPEASAMVEALTQADGAMKTLTTFVDGFLKHLRPDGKFHTTYFLGHAEFEGHDGDDSGTVTGRLSAKNPPFQVIPKKTKWAKRIRECFPAPQGKVMLSVDFSQGELRVIACWAPEPTMIQAYLDDQDLHAVTGAKLAQVNLAEFLTWKDNPDEDLAALFEKNRGNAKPANFGLCFGMQVDGFIAYSWANYGIRLTYEEGEAMRNAFFQLYPGLLSYHEKQKTIANMTGRVVSPLGRIRHLPMLKSWDREIRSKAQRQAINSPIQSCLTDMMIWAIALIDDAYPGGEIETVGVIHDALVAYIPDQDPLLWAGRVTEIMSNLPFDQLSWKPQLKFTVDAEIGPNLAALKKVKLAS